MRLSDELIYFLKGRDWRVMHKDSKSPRGERLIHLSAFNYNATSSIRFERVMRCEMYGLFN